MSDRHLQKMLIDDLEDHLVRIRQLVRVAANPGEKTHASAEIEAVEAELKRRLP